MTLNDAYKVMHNVWMRVENLDEIELCDFHGDAKAYHEKLDWTLKEYGDANVTDLMAFTDIEGRMHMLVCIDRN